MKKNNHSSSASLEEMELWPDLIWQLATLLRAGLSPVAAFSKLLADSEEPATPSDPLERILTARDRKNLSLARQDIDRILETCQRQSALGLALGESLEQLAVQREYSARRLAEFSACWRISERTGAPLALVLERLARFYEGQIDLSQARDSAMSGPKSTGHILSWLPLLGLGLGILMGTDPLGLIFGSVLGAVIGLAGLALALAGRRWTAWLVRLAEAGEL